MICPKFNKISVLILTLIIGYTPPALSVQEPRTISMARLMRDNHKARMESDKALKMGKHIVNTYREATFQDRITLMELLDTCRRPHGAWEQVILLLKNPHPLYEAYVWVDFAGIAYQMSKISPTNERAWFISLARQFLTVAWQLSEERLDWISYKYTFLCGLTGLK
jgi:hypothetical protein